MLRAISVDDELHNHLLLKRFVEAEGLVEVVGQFADPFTALEKISELRPDAMFVDIEMPVMNGLELAEKAVSLCPDIQTIFVTAFSHYAVEAFRVNALDYLLKPIDPQEMSRVIHKLLDSAGVKEILASGAAALDESCMIRCFGEFEIYGANSQQKVHWLTAKVEELAAYLLMHSHRSISKEEICEALWPESDYQKALVNLYTTVYRLRKTITQEGVPLVIRSSKSTYEVEVKGCRIDVVEFERLTQGLEKMRALPEGDAGTNSLLAAAACFRGELFASRTYGWSAAYSEALNQMFRLLCYRLSGFFTEKQDLEQAAVQLENLLKHFPDEEKACMLLMDLYHIQGNSAGVDTLYKDYTHYLREELSVAPTDEFEIYYKSLR